MDERRAAFPPNGRTRHLKRVPLFTGERVAEVIPLDSCRLVTTPTVLRESVDVPSWVEANVQDEELITLPYVMSGAERWIKRDFLPYFQKNVVELWRSKQFEFYQPTVISEVEIDGERKFAVRVCESVDRQSIPKDGTRHYYRTERAVATPSILQHGFYQLPGRMFLRDNPDALYSGEEGVVLAFNLPNRDLISFSDKSSLNDTTFDDIALSPFSVSMRAQLPQELRVSIGDLYLFDGNSEGTFLNLDILSKQVLAWGEITGMLMRVDPAFIERKV